MNWNQFDSGTTTALTLNLDNMATTSVYLPDPLIDWFPKSSIWKKYLPIWHLVKSYPKHKHESAWYDESQGIHDWYCKYCGKEMY